jgi:hypothetical protein
MRWQRLSITVRIVCGLLALGILPAFWMIGYITNLNEAWHLFAAIAGGVAFAFAAIVGRFPDTSVAPDQQRGGNEK